MAERLGSAKKVHVAILHADALEEESKALIDRIVARGEEERAELRKFIEEELKRARTGIATRKDIEELSAKIDALAEKLAGE
jgi:polyhydroxyalkanoate synthesis regulator phasin